MTTNRTSTIFAVSSIAALALLTISMLTNARPGVSSTNGFSNEAGANLAQRQGEWTTGIGALQAYLDQR